MSTGKLDSHQDFYLFPRERKEGKPVFYAQFRDPKTRKILTARSTGHTNRTAAHDWAVREYQAMAGPRKVAQTLGEFAAPFYAPGCPYVAKQRNTKGMTPKTQKDKRTHVEAILKCDWLAATPLAELDRAALERFRDEYLVGEVYGGKATRTSQMVMEVLKTIVAQAVEKALVPGNPVYRLPTGTYAPKVRASLSEKELDALLKPANFTNPRFWRATMVAALLGMRVGEVRGLTWGSLDPERRIVHVDQQIRMDGETTLPKWRKRRTSPYPKALRELLEPLRGEPPDLVFVWGEGSVNANRWETHFVEAAAKVKLTVTLHGLRHSLNTILLERGIPDAVIRAALGWSDPKIQQRYTHISFGKRYQSPLIDSVVAAIQRGE